MTEVGGNHRRIAVGFADQALAGATNVLFGLLIARRFGPEGLGEFALVFACYVLALGACRALTSEPLVVRYSGAGEDQWAGATALAIGAAFAVGTFSGLVLLIVAPWLPGSRGALTILALVLPFLMVQDTWRYTFTAAGKPEKALVNDLVWVVLFAPPVMLVPSLVGSLERVMSVWGLAGLCAAFAGLVQAKVLPQMHGVVEWLRREYTLASRFLADYIATTGSSQLAVFGIAAVTSISTLGELRGAQLAFAPVGLLQAGAAFVGVPEGVRLAQSSPAKLKGFCGVIAGVMALSSFGWIVLVYAVGDRTGPVLLGTAWPAAKLLTVPTALYVAASGIIMGAGIGLRSLADTSRNLRARAITAPFLVAGAILGALWGRAPGAAWGLVVASCIGALVWWGQLLNSPSRELETILETSAAR